MEIGTIIKKYRRERDMTQEQLSEYLRVSVSAVSQWESGKTAPDLSAIPAICNLFGISADELLGIDREHKQEKIDEILKSASRYSDRGYMTEAAEILEAGLREFPGNYDLMANLMFAYSYNNEHLDDTIRLGEAILERCTHDNHRSSAKLVLCYAYRDKGETDKALKIAKSFSSLFQTRESFLAILLKGTEGYRRRQYYLYSLLDEMDNCLRHMNYQLDDGSWSYTDDELAVIRDKYLALYAILFEDGNYVFYHSRIAEIHQHQAKYYAEKQDMERTLYHLNAAADHAITFCKSEGVGMHTALLFRGVEDKSFSTSVTYNDA